jgi:predicted peroxiredoxin
MTSNGRVIVGCTHGEEDSDRVLVAYLTAGAALDHGKEVVMWLTAEGVRLALKGYAERIRADQDPRSSACTPSSSTRGALLRVPDLLQRTPARPTRPWSRAPNYRAPPR